MHADQNAMDKKLVTTFKHSIVLHKLVKDNYQDLLDNDNKLAQSDNKLQFSIGKLKAENGLIEKKVEKLTCG